MGLGKPASVLSRLPLPMLGGFCFAAGEWEAGPGPSVCRGIRDRQCPLDSQFPGPVRPDGVEMHFVATGHGQGVWASAKVFVTGPPGAVQVTSYMRRGDSRGSWMQRGVPRTDRMLFSGILQSGSRTGALLGTGRTQGRHRSNDGVWPLWLAVPAVSVTAGLCLLSSHVPTPKASGWGCLGDGCLKRG